MLDADEPKLSPLRRAAAFLGLKRSIMGMLSMVVLVGMGEHMAERYLPMYLEHLGEGMTFTLIAIKLPVGLASIGLLAFLDDLLSALYSFPGGYLSDRWGAKRALLGFNALSMLGYLIVIFIHTWWAVLLGAAFFISWSAISLPATMEIISKAVPKTQRTMGVSVQALVRRIPKTLGPFVGGAFIGLWGVAAGVRIAFMFALGLALLAMLLQQILIEEDAPADGGKRAERNPFKLWPLMSPGLRNLLASDILIRFCERIPDVLVILWVTHQLVNIGGMSLTEAAFWFGILSVIENVTAVLCYIPVARMADRFGKKPFVAITFGFFALFPLALLFSHTLWAFVAVFVLRGLKEFGEPTRKALIMDLAPEERKAAMFGLYYLARDVIVSFAALSGAFLWMISPQMTLLVAFGFGVIGATWFLLRGRDVSAQRQ